jgi:hypothetical protein
MNEIITTYAEQLTNERSERLLFRYYPNLPEGSLVLVGTREGDLENFRAGDCYEFIIDFFGYKKGIYLRDKREISGDTQFEGRLYEFTLDTIEDDEPAELQKNTAPT